MEDAFVPLEYGMEEAHHRDLILDGK